MLIPVENPVMINRSKGYAESSNGIGLVSFHMVVLSLLDEELKKTGIINASSPFYHYILKAIFVAAHSLNVQGKITLSFDIS